MRFLGRLMHQPPKSFGGNARTSQSALKIELNDCLGIAALCRNGRLEEALSSLRAMDEQNIRVDPEIYGCLIQACANKKATAEGKRIHIHMITAGIPLNSFLASNLVGMYAKCGCLEEAREVFDKMSE